MIGQHDEIGDHLEVIDACEFALHGVGAAGGEEAGDGSFFFFANDGGDGGGEEPTGLRHVFTLFGGFVETVTGFGIRQVAPDADALEAVEHGLGLGEGQQRGGVVADVDEVMRRKGAARLERLGSGFALGA